MKSRNQISISEKKRLLTFQEHTPIMISKLSRYCQNTRHDKVYYLAHNGFQHDFLIILNNLKESDFLDSFKESFQDAICLDSLSFSRY